MVSAAFLIERHGGRIQRGRRANDGISDVLHRRARVTIPNAAEHTPVPEGGPTTFYASENAERPTGRRRRHAQNLESANYRSGGSPASVSTRKMSFAAKTLPRIAPSTLTILPTNSGAE